MAMECSVLFNWSGIHFESCNWILDLVSMGMGLEGEMHDLFNNQPPQCL